MKLSVFWRMSGIAAAVLCAQMGTASAQTASSVGVDSVRPNRSGYISSPSGLFGYKETGNSNIAAFTKWTDMLNRYKDLMKQQAKAGTNGSTCVVPVLEGAVPCGHDEWDQLVKTLKGKPLEIQLEAVNTYLNKFPYITDMVNWGVGDYWEDPAEFFRKDGDCEDYAISKYLTLKALGVDPKRMRVVILEDMNLHVSHAVLAVAVGGDWKILDNQARDVISHRMIHHYQPIYSINESGWWLHRPAS